MLELILMRHAKTEPAGPHTRDRERALTDRGRADAVLIGETLKAKGWLPDRVLCSPAVRTRQTADALIEAFGTRPAVAFVEALYGARSPDYLGVIARSGDAARRLLVIGHNPTIHVTARKLAQSGSSAQRERLTEKFPTGAIAVIDVRIENWAEIASADGHLAAFVAPRDLGGGGAA